MENSLTNYLDTAGSLTTNILGALQKPAPQTTVIQQPAGNGKFPAWGWAAIGGVVLVLGFLGFLAVGRR